MRKKKKMGQSYISYIKRKLYVHRFWISRINLLSNLPNLLNSPPGSCVMFVREKLFEMENGAWNWNCNCANKNFNGSHFRFNVICNIKLGLLFNRLQFVAFCSFFPCSLTVFHRVDNEKALELTNSTVFHRDRQWKSSRAGQQIFF